MSSSSSSSTVLELPGDPPRVRLGTDLLALIRPAQWPKNLLVVPLALIDAPAWHLAGLTRLAWAVAVFVAASALVYIVNDIADRHRDRGHPRKRDRPVASGRISVPVAWGFAGVVGAGLAALLAPHPAQAWPVVVYLVLNVAYSAKLKHLPLLDVFVVSAGFLLRMALGYVALDVAYSGWLLVSVFTLCLLLSLGKRRYELVVASRNHRPSLSGYSLPLIDNLLLLNAGLTGMAFLLYMRDEAPVGAHGQLAMLCSVPFALFGLFRYLQGVLVRQSEGDPVRALLRDRVLVVNSLLWGLLLAGFLVAARYPELLS
ncbi:UbiA prenyltransferase family protein [Longispora urticae]